MVLGIGSSGVPPFLDIDQLYNNIDAQFILLGLSKPIKGLMISSFKFGTGSIYSDAESMGAANEALNSLISSVSGLINKVWQDKENGGLIEQIQIKSIAQTILTWTGNEPIKFDLPFLFIAIHPTDDVRENIKILQEGICPVFEGNWNFGTRIYAPNKYAIGNANIAQGCVSLSIGRWFQTPEVFVILGVSCEFSKETIKSGLPLYCVGNIEIKAYRMLELNEVQGFFHEGNLNSNNPIIPVGGVPSSSGSIQ